MKRRNYTKEPNHLELYAEFRKELDRFWVPQHLNNLASFEILHHGKLAGIIFFNDDYIDCLYILPKYRRKGIGTKGVIKWYSIHHNKHPRLHIIDNNVPALIFWNEIFYLRKIEEGYTDTLYEIEGLRDE